MKAQDLTARQQALVKHAGGMGGWLTAARVHSTYNDDIAPLLSEETGPLFEYEARGVTKYRLTEAGFSLWVNELNGDLW